MTEPSRLRRRVRGAISALLVLLTCIALLLSTIAVWARGLVLDSDRFARTGAAALTNDAVAEVIADWTAGEVTQLAISYIDLDIPLYLRPFAPRFESAVQAALASQLHDIIVSDATESALRVALKAAHGRLVDASGKADAVVTVNLIPLVGRGLLLVQDEGLIPESIELPNLQPGVEPEQQIAAIEAAIGRDLPDDFGQFTIYDGATMTRVGGVLAAVATVIDIVRRVTTLTLIATAALAIVSLIVSPRRWRTAIYLVVGAAVAMFVGSIAIDAIRERLPDLVRPATRDAVLQVFDDFFTGLLKFTRISAILLAAIGIAAVLARWLRGGRSSARAAELVRVLRANPDAVRIAALVITLLTLAGFGLSIASVVIVSLIWIGALAASPVAASEDMTIPDA